MNFIPQLEQVFAAYRKVGTPELKALQRAFQTATDAGCTDMAVYKDVEDLLAAIKNDVRRK